MVSLREKEKFVELRAQGFSFDKISAEIGVSKPTLIKWSRECSDQIANIFYCNIEVLLEKYRLVKQFRVEAFSRLLCKALDEMDKRDFTSVSTKDLLLIINAIEVKLEREITKIQYHTGDFASQFELDLERVKEKTLPLFY